MKRTAIITATTFLTLFISFGLPPAAAQYSDRIFETSTRTSYGLGQILPDLRKASIIFLGEQHSNISHHDLQLRILRTLKNLDSPVTVGLEMIASRDQDHLDAWVQGTLSESAFKSIHENNWGKTWELYRPVYSYARDKKIPLLGLNVPEEITTQAARRGFSSLSPEQRSELPMVSCNIDEEYRSFIQKALSVHGTSADIREFDNFCEAQLIWDTTMAYRLVRYLELNPGRKVVVLAGNSHSWRPGIPQQLSRFADGIDYRIILPEIPPAQTRRTIDASLTDYLWLLE